MVSRDNTLARRIDTGKHNDGICLASLLKQLLKLFTGNSVNGRHPSGFKPSSRLHELPPSTDKPHGIRKSDNSTAGKRRELSQAVSPSDGGAALSFFS